MLDVRPRRRWLIPGLLVVLYGAGAVVSPAELEHAPPQHPGYARLRTALPGLREIEAKGGWPLIPDGPKLARGSRSPRVALLRQRLGAPPGELFDEALAASLRRAQEHHGIAPDGRLGPMTLAELNVPVARRIAQVELHLERWLSIPSELGDPYVFVNIPGYDLELMRGGVSTWRTRIVVGKAFTPTPVLSDQIVSVVINPPWNVPESIALSEYLPELRKNPKALKRHGLHLVKGAEEDAVEIDPKTVNWHTVKEDDFPYRLRQDPGPDNALGRVKFLLTNNLGVYLHDTPARSLFGHLDRDLSHGCIRVENPLELARLLLGESSPEVLSKALDQPKEKHISVKPPVPVHILYLTAWVDDAGALHFSPDVYGFDGPQGKEPDRVVAGGKEPIPPSAH